MRVGETVLDACVEAVEGTPRAGFPSIHKLRWEYNRAGLSFGIAAHIQRPLALLLWYKMLLGASQGIAISLLGNGNQ